MESKNHFETAVCDVCDDVKDLLIRKNRDYGNSFKKTYDEYGLLSLIIRLSDKLERLKSLNEKEPAITTETIQDTIRDIAGYCLLALAIDEERKYGELKNLDL